MELQKNDLREKIIAAEKAEDNMAEQYEVLKDELAIVEKQIIAADNSDKEERIGQLEAEMREIAQDVANEEKSLYLLEQFMKAKMMILSKMVNEKFGIVNWKLFDKQVNGAVVECCECTVNGVPYSSLNTGHRIVAGLDIINALSAMHDVTAPVFIDNAEAVNEYNLPAMKGQWMYWKGKGGVGCIRKRWIFLVHIMSAWIPKRVLVRSLTISAENRMIVFEMSVFWLKTTVCDCTFWWRMRMG